MNAVLRLVPEGSPPRATGTPLASADDLEEHLRTLLTEGFDGEVLVRGHDTARICIYEGKIPWVRGGGYPEHLGDVLRRELGLPVAELRRAMAHCRNTGQRLGEGLLAFGLVQPAELRECMWRHISDQLREILAWPGPVVVEANPWPHRYDHAFTFELDDLLRCTRAPTPAEQRRLAALVARCRDRLPNLVLVCVVDSEEGTPLCGVDEVEGAAARDLLGLCLVGVRRLVSHRVTRSEGPPQSMVLSAPDGCMVVQQLPWSSEWLLVLGGPEPPGRLLSVAQAVTRDDLRCSALGTRTAV